MSQNPFAPPETFGTSAAENVSDGFVRATQGQRFLNFFIDGIIIRILSFGVGIVVAIIFLAANGSTTITPQQELTLNLIALPFGLLAVVAYFIVMEAAFQIRLGKLVTGTRVVTADGRQPTFGQIVGRSFARLIPFEPFSFLGGNPCSGWHDKLSGTIVIKTR